jgi:hypothetical protein
VPAAEGRRGFRSPERVGVWRRATSAADRIAVEQGAGPLMAALGYAAAE